MRPYTGSHHFGGDGDSIGEMDADGHDEVDDEDDDKVLIPTTEEIFILPH